MKIKGSFLIYFLGVTFLLFGGMRIFWEWESAGCSVKGTVRRIQELWEGDFQESGEFRDYICGKLQTFLTMAVGGRLTEDDGVGDYGWLYADNWEEYLENGEYDAETRSRLRTTRKKLEEAWKKEAEEYHEAYKWDKNLLYVIRKGDKVLYANTDQLQVRGYGNVWEKPSGYDFTLFFDGKEEKPVRIARNGQAEDVYGDGFYKGDEDWYVPGYNNFPLDERYSGIQVLMAVIREPVVYTEMAENGFYTETSGSLYQMQKEWEKSGRALPWFLGALVLGLALLGISFFLRRARREARRRIAGVTEKIWVECKLLLLAGFLFEAAVLLLVWLKGGYRPLGMPIYLGDWIWKREWADRASLAAGAAAALNFWYLYLLGNDLHYNRKKIFSQALSVKLYRKLTFREMTNPLALRMAKRGRRQRILTLVLGGLLIVLLIGGGLLSLTWDWYKLLVLWGVLLFGTVFCVLLGEIHGREAVEDAKALEVLTRRIGEIRAGKYEPGQKEVEALLEQPERNLQEAMADLEAIREGMERAIEEQMKSERMKVELVANVSHDLKTPLTSIISYVELLKQEELPEPSREYVKILDEKAKRLNHMVQDVFSISKAASGELEIQAEVLDFGKLLRQTMADMEEEMTSCRLAFRTNLPADPVLIRADGQKLYRVFQNLIQNVIKYSLEGSRVYIALEEEGGRAVASVKNTSREELNPNLKYAERFTRGDQSRTDGGSGLGLSIAQSFTEACGGQFTLETIADLFVVKVAFPIVKERKEAGPAAE